MHEHSGSTNTIWRERAQVPEFRPLEKDLLCDVCVVGAGIAGVVTAYLLAREGKTVVVLDDGPIAGGETERTTAHLSNAIDDRYYHLEKLHGEQGSRLAAESHAAAISKIESIGAEECIDCDFQRLDGYLFQPPGADPEQLRAELAAARRAGVEVEEVVRPPLPANVGAALLFRRQAQFHPLKFLARLVGCIQRRGGRFYCDTRVVSVTGGESSFAETESGKRVRSGAVVVATNSPINNRYLIHTKQAAYRSYVVGLLVPAGAVPLALYWDTAQDAEAARHDKNAPYHYVRLQRLEGEAGRELLIVGGEDHKTGQARDMQERWMALERWARQNFPMAGELAYRWSGQVMETVDGLAYIGRNPDDAPNIFVCTGDSGHGMTHGTIAGMLLTDLILGRQNPWTNLYDPSRVKLRAAGDFISENLNVAAQYRDLLTRGDVSSLDKLLPDTGAVIRSGATKIAVYRDPSGTLYAYSAICPHLKCVVQWNPGEKSWDCPCHGSRFTRLGEVINGPATVNLSSVDLPQQEPKVAEGAGAPQ